MYRLYDMHCHLDFMSNAPEVASYAASQEVGILCATVTPQGYRDALSALQPHPNVWVGAGLHPWWIADGSCGENEVARAVELARSTALVAEVGLDFSRRGGDDEARRRQLDAFERIAIACADSPAIGRPKLLSLHAVRSADVVLDALERTGCLSSCTCIFHWFSGTSAELARARAAGCFFSVNEMMLATRKGREYARQLPEGRLLLETDLPPAEGAPFDPDELIAQLERTLEQLAAIRGVNASALGARIAKTSVGLLRQLGGTP